MEVLKMTGNGLTMVHAMKSSPSSGSILSMGGISKNVCLKKGSFGKGGTVRSRMAPSTTGNTLDVLTLTERVGRGWG